MKKLIVWIPFFGIYSKKAEVLMFNTFWLCYQIVSSLGAVCLTFYLI